MTPQRSLVDDGLDPTGPLKPLSEEDAAPEAGLAAPASPVTPEVEEFVERLLASAGELRTIAYAMRGMRKAADVFDEVAVQAIEVTAFRQAFEIERLARDLAPEVAAALLD